MMMKEIIKIIPIFGPIFGKKGLPMLRNMGISGDQRENGRREEKPRVRKVLPRGGNFLPQKSCAQTKGRALGITVWEP